MPTAKAGPITIPVVVHVVYNNASENISVAQVDSQIKALNRDYQAKNTDKSKVPVVWNGLVADVKIKFELATKDPKGNSTDGITRTKTAETSFGTDDGVKSSATGGIDAWPTDKYLNIWVCNLGEGLLGYAQFPGGPAATDGVVILNIGFGTVGTAAAPYNLGRTTVHEVGHWLNLNHIWGDTNDCSGTFTEFRDDAATSIGSGAPPFAGSFQPDGTLSDFAGHQSNGTWKLRISDVAGGDTGVAGCFQMDIVHPK